MNCSDIEEGFRFDLWANRKWLECLNRRPMDSPDRAIFAHLLSAQQVWLSRCNGLSVESFPSIEATDEELLRLHSGWIDVAQRLAHDPVIEYRRMNGEALTSTFREIALHVINHGTYHRGELRGLCRARGDDDFPETDRIGFTLQAKRTVE